MTTINSTDTTKQHRLSDGDLVVSRLESVGARNIKRHWSYNRLTIHFGIHTSRIDLVRNAVVKAIEGTHFEHQQTSDGEPGTIPASYYALLIWRIRK